MEYQESRHKPIELLRFAGLFTWLCAAIPLILIRYWYSVPLSNEQYLALWILHLVFGFTYWNQVRSLPVRTGLAHRLLILAVLTISALGVSWMAQDTTKSVTWNGRSAKANRHPLVAPMSMSPTPTLQPP